MVNGEKEQKLTEKQKRFCEEYIIDWNGTRAAIAAGYSKKTAKEQDKSHERHNGLISVELSEIS